MVYLLPPVLQIVFLGLLGACLGSAINYGIYAWTWFLNRRISPWQAAPEGAVPRTPKDRVPILGWLSLRRETPLHGGGHWIRPMFIEVGCLLGLPGLYFWLLGGGLVGGNLAPWPLGWPIQVEIWFWLYAILLGLMMIATFIDFDERTIPDSVTIPGTLFALLMAAAFPTSRLPEVTSNLAGTIVQPISFANGAPLQLLEIESTLFARGVSWHQTQAGLWMSLIIFWVWIFALLPKIASLRFGISKGLWLMVYSCLRPKRRTTCGARIQQRRPFLETLLLFALGLSGTAAIILAKFLLPEAHWESLFQSFFGLGFGGMMIWGIRMIGQFALQREAMGFGDVTLMAMIGAFLGWQVTLLTLPIASVLALAVTVVLIFITRDSQLAFGPYLCLGCAFALFTWHSIWPATQSYFSLGEWLFVLLAAMLGLMMLMLVGLSAFKRLLGLNQFLV
jgi:leader peptidase (prepilin peptidase) / N-methyltransferase